MIESIETRIEKKSKDLENRQADLDEQSDLIDKNIRLFTWLAWVCIILGLGVLVLGFLLLAWKKIPDLNELGGFLSGTLASVWSLSGLFFIYVAFLGQKKQLLLQQIELLNSQLEVMYTQSELKGQKEAMNIQNQLITQQQFESTFFKLLEHHVDTVKGIEYDTAFSVGPKHYRLQNKGKRIFANIVTPLSQALQQLYSNQDNTLESLMSDYTDLYNFLSADLAVYFRNLYNIVKFIHESKIPNRKRYSNILRAQLSPAEVELLLYNGISENGLEKFHPLICEYSLLKHCQNKWLRAKAIELNWYPLKAFDK